MFDIGGGEFLLILLVILLLFGPKKLPELARAIGKGAAQLRKAQVEFQRNINTIQEEINHTVQEPVQYVEREIFAPSTYTPPHEGPAYPPADQEPEIIADGKTPEVNPETQPQELTPIRISSAEGAIAREQVQTPSSNNEQ